MEPKRIKVSVPAVLPILNASSVPPVSISNLEPFQSKSEFPLIALAPVTVQIVLLVDPVNVVFVASTANCQEQVPSPSTRKYLVDPD